MCAALRCRRDTGLPGPSVCHTQAPSDLEVAGSERGPQSPCSLTYRLGEAEMRDFRDQASASQPSSCNFWTISALKRTDGHFGKNEDAAVDRMSVPMPSHCCYPSSLSASPPGTAAAVTLPEQAGRASPGLTVAVWVGELELAGQEGLGSVAGESQR